MLNCTCSHNRLEHIGGDFISDSKVLKCNIENCTCSKYHGDKNNDDSYIYKSLAITLAFFAIGVGVYFAIGAAFDVILDPYTISIVEENPTHLVYENGTRVIDNFPEIDLKVNLSDSLKMIVFFGFYVMYAIFAFIFILPVYDASKRKAIHSK